MNRQQFLGITGGTIVMAGVTYYGLSDRRNFVRADSREERRAGTIKLTPDERSILFLAALAPSGHNTQPWFVKHIEPYHWIVGNDKTRWLPGVDPTQRETLLSIGAFLQNLEYAASNLGYNCQIDTVAINNQDEDVAVVKLSKSGSTASYDSQKMIRRRTLRSTYLTEVLTKEDRTYLLKGESDFIQYIPNTAKEYQWLNEQTIEANRIQTYRDAAQQELADWIRFSSKDAQAHDDGLTTAGMEIEGILGWVLRNFYGKADVLKDGFREQSIDKVKQQVSQSAGWLVITSNDTTVATLLETGKRMQRLCLTVRERGIAIHPMTQILEEASTNQTVNQAIGISDPVQFILRTGYVKTYPEPVSLRRSVDWFMRT